MIFKDIAKHKHAEQYERSHWKTYNLLKGIYKLIYKFFLLKTKEYLLWERILTKSF